jgi:hypothetical protein
VSCPGRAGAWRRRAARRCGRLPLDAGAAGRGRWATPQGCARVKSSFVFLILKRHRSPPELEQEQSVTLDNPVSPVCTDTLPRQEPKTARIALERTKPADSADYGLGRSDLSHRAKVFIATGEGQGVLSHLSPRQHLCAAHS